MNKGRMVKFGVLIAVLVLIAGLILHTPIMAQSPAILIEPSHQEGSACAGRSVTYTFKITNNTASAQAFKLNYQNIWSVAGQTSTSIIDIGAFVDIDVVVFVPPKSVEGSYDELTVNVSTESTADTASATAVTTSSLCSTYQDLANVPTGREVRAPSVVYWEGKLYKIGGYGYVDNVGSARAWLDIYDIATDSWSTGADMPGARYWMDCEAIKGKIYCAGGYSTSAQSTLYIYDIKEATWETGPALPAARYNYASAKINDKYYVIGGYGGSVLSSMIVFDPDAGTWDATKASMGTARRHFQAGVIGGYIYAAGGYTGSSFLSSVEFYNPVENVWKTAADMPLPRVNAADAVLHDRYFVLLGGSATSTSSVDVVSYAYDALNDRWFRLPDLAHSLYGAEADGDGDQIWTASGRLFDGIWRNSPFIFRLAFCDPYFLNFLPLIMK